MKELDEIVDMFALLGDWDQRYEFIIEMGESLPEMPEKYKIEDLLVKGCMSQVWLRSYTKPGKPEEVYFHGDSDTAVIKGIVALLIQLIEGKSAEEIQKLDLDEIFTRLQLADHLSPSRHVGVYAIVNLLKKQALDISEQSLQTA